MRKGVNVLLATAVCAMVCLSLSPALAQKKAIFRISGESMLSSIIDGFSEGYKKAGGAVTVRGMGIQYQSTAPHAPPGPRRHGRAHQAFHVQDLQGGPEGGTGWRIKDVSVC